MGSESALILVAEDEPDIRALICAYLEREGYRTASVGDGDAAVSAWRKLKPDLIVLDILMPRRDGLDVLKEIRKSDETPVIFVTALGDDVDKLVGFRIGADDYVAKPVNPAEIAARVKAVMRRASGTARANMIRLGTLEVDLDSMNAKANGHSIALSPAEFRFLSHMARQPKRVFTREELLSACLPDSDAFDRTVDTHLYAIRKKLEKAGILGALQSVRGVGYRLNI